MGGELNKVGKCFAHQFRFKLRIMHELKLEFSGSMDDISEHKFCSQNSTTKNNLWEEWLEPLLCYSGVTILSGNIDCHSYLVLPVKEANWIIFDSICVLQIMKWHSRRNA